MAVQALEPDVLLADPVTPGAAIIADLLQVVPKYQDCDAA